MSKPIEYELDIQRYNGPKKPNMHLTAAKRVLLPLKLLAHKVIAKERPKVNDFAFIKDVTSGDAHPKFNGYNAKLCRERGQSLSPKNKAVYMPLIDIPLADPDTMMTAMVQAA
jgi:hypothetical protein